jgi:hypothetical protein
MVFTKITDESIEKMCGWLEFYDEHHFFPFRKKRVTLNLSGRAYAKLKKKQNKSKYVEGLIK